MTKLDCRLSALGFGQAEIAEAVLLADIRKKWPDEFEAIRMGKKTVEQVRRKLKLDSICSGKKTRGMSKDTLALIDYARTLLAANHPMTLRQLHYAIFSRNEIEYANDKASYSRLGRATTTARRAYRDWELAEGSIPMPPHGIDPSWMVDESRQPETVSVWKDAHQYIEAVGWSYRRDNWQTQPNHVELWSEKATILGSIRPVAQKWGITTRVCHGYGSCGQEMDVGHLFEDIGSDKEITVLYAGDHDPSGVQMEEDIHRRVEQASGIKFTMLRLAIHPEDIRKFNLPPQRIKEKDSRAAGFKRQFGADAPTVELDALPVDELRNRIEKAVLGLVDHELWNRQIRVQKVELNCIREFTDRIKNLPQLGGGGRAPA
jgi:hypothetical protein